ncbi:hypothetical protein ACHAXT_001876 [Thalassiosira profunda]
MKKTAMLVMVAAIVACVKAGDYQDGYEDGKYECKELFSGDCDDSWEIEELCTEELIDGMFRRHRRDNHKERSYKRGARKGVKKAIRKIEKECLHTDIGQCNDLGENAAEEIAMDLCESVGASFDKVFRPDYKDECREEGIDICQGEWRGGMIASKFYNWCDGESLSKHKLEEGKDKCRRKVNRLLDWRLRH